MASGEEKSSDLYAVLGLNKECTPLELRDAYKKLAMRWHPDRCSASGNSKFIDEAKTKFQAIQEAYSVLSDENKRFLYDVGAYASDGDDDDDDDDENGMGDFLGEMAVMMNQTKPCDDAQQRFEDLQTLFDKMFGKDMEAFNSASQSSSSHNANFNNNSNDSYINKRNCSEMSSGNDNNMEFQMGCDNFQNFCVGAEGSTEASKGRGGSSSSGGGSSRRRTSRKQRFTSSRIPV